MSDDDLARRVRERIAEGQRLLEKSDAMLAEGTAHRWRLFRNARILRETRQIGATIDDLIADNAQDLAAVRTGR